MRERSAIDRIRELAAGYPEVGTGTVCGKESFKARKKNFLFLSVGDKSYSLKVKLSAALPEAEALAAEHPDRYSVGSTGWVDLELPHAESPPGDLAERWIEESYRLNAPKTLVAQLD